MLIADEPPPFSLVNRRGAGEVLLIADHASNRIPRCMHGLGLKDDMLNSHIGWDIGVEALVLTLSKLLDTPVLMTNYSRLVIDCNRATDHPESIPDISDGLLIPGNQDITRQERATRKEIFFDPYHNAISRLLNEPGRHFSAILSIHSFTPVLQGSKRPWSVGVCYGEDKRLAELFLPELGQRSSDPIGDNAPYAIETGIDYSLPFHTANNQLLHIMLEFNQAKINNRQDTLSWAHLVNETWRAVKPVLFARSSETGNY